ncbi:glycosyltransferase family 4 protein [Natronobiforma cellulositropha]|uniref:glycosyltransferase family 4 protein n=1 Tax=Natronobiforma cellulositropha TaxID=1679076 RepID=UPI0021D5CC2D|nr:glycosyltransferase family 4 protein [Natronobiforma cellulositropha]
MNVAIARPVPARNNTSFDAQLRCYEHICATSDVTIDVVADRRNGLQSDTLSVVEVRPDARDRVRCLARKGFNKVTSRYDFVSSDYSSLGAVLADGDYDVVETSDPTLYPYAWRALEGARRLEAGIVCGSSVTLTLSTPVNDRRAREVMDAAGSILCITPLAAERFQRLGLLETESERVVYPGHPIDTDVFAPPATDRTDRTGPITVLTIGRLEQRKGYEYLLEAITTLVDDGVDLEWEVVGDGPLRGDLERRLDAAGLTEQVTLHGVVDHARIHERYRQADIFALHSLRTERWEEYFGVVYAEAMSAGLPVVASESGAIPWVVRDGVDGMLVEERSAAGIADAVRTLVDDPQLRAELGANARAAVLERFSKERVAETFVSAWEQAANAGVRT